MARSHRCRAGDAGIGGRRSRHRSNGRFRRACQGRPGNVERPILSLFGLTAFGGAFLIRALVWRRVLPDLTLGQSCAAIHVALLGNHLPPFRLGEPLRVASVVERARIPTAEASASTVTLRAADLLTVVGLAWILGAATSPSCAP